MLLCDNHPSNDNMIDSKKYHIFYDKKGHVSLAILKYFLYYLIVWCIFYKISKNHTMQRASFFQYFGSKLGSLSFFIELRSFFCNLCHFP